MDRGRFKTGSKSHNDWVDWLSDKPPPAPARQALRQSRVQQAAGYQPRAAVPKAGAGATPPQPDLTININLQKIKLPRSQLSKLKLPNFRLIRLRPSKKIALALVIMAGGVATYFILAGGSHPNAGQASASAAPVRTSPSFQTVAPVSKPQLGEFAGHVTAYDGKRDIYSYADSINGDRITISEQPAPKNLGTIDQALQKIATQAGASHKIDTKNGSAYIRTDQETGAQTVVCSVDDVLLFINSSTGFSDADWLKYISDLQ